MDGLPGYRYCFFLFFSSSPFFLSGFRGFAGQRMNNVDANDGELDDGFSFSRLVLFVLLVRTFRVEISLLLSLRCDAMRYRNR